MDTTLFPKRPKDFFPIAITPVICAPILGGVDRFAVAALCSGRGANLLVKASIEQSVRRLYPSHFEGVLVGVDIALCDIAEAAARPDFTAIGYRTVVSSISLGEPDLTEGSDLGAAGERWLLAMSSLHRPLDGDTADCCG